MVKKTKKGRPTKAPTFIIKKDQAEMTDVDNRHRTNIFSVKQKKGKGGKIIMELTPATKLDKKREKLIDELTEKLKDNIDKEDLMKDILTDLSIKNLERLDQSLKGNVKVKAREGCYNLLIKNSRMKKGICLPIRS